MSEAKEDAGTEEETGNKYADHNDYSKDNWWHNPGETIQRDDTRTSGMGIVNTIDTLYQACESHNQVMQGVAGAGLALDVLGLVLDPLGTVIAAALGWLIEHVTPFRIPLDALFGDPEGITTAVAALDEEKTNVDGYVKELRDKLKDLVGGGDNAGAKDTKDAKWTGEGAKGFAKAAKDRIDSLEAQGEGLASASKTMSICGAVIGAVRGIVRDLATAVIGGIIGGALAAVAAMPFTAGMSVPIFLGTVAGVVAAALAKIGIQISRLTKNLQSAAKASDDVADAAGAAGRAAGDGGSAGSAGARGADGSTGGGKPNGGGGDKTPNGGGDKNGKPDTNGNNGGRPGENNGGPSNINKEPDNGGRPGESNGGPSNPNRGSDEPPATPPPGNDKSPESSGGDKSPDGSGGKGKDPYDPNLDKDKGPNSSSGNPGGGGSNGGKPDLKIDTNVPKDGGPNSSPSPNSFDTAPTSPRPETPFQTPPQSPAPPPTPPTPNGPGSISDTLGGGAPQPKPEETPLPPSPSSNTPPGSPAPSTGGTPETPGGSSSQPDTTPHPAPERPAPEPSGPAGREDGGQGGRDTDNGQGGRDSDNSQGGRDTDGQGDGKNPYNLDKLDQEGKGLGNKLDELLKGDHSKEITPEMKQSFDKWTGRFSGFDPNSLKGVAGISDDFIDKANTVMRHIADPSHSWTAAGMKSTLDFIRFGMFPAMQNGGAFPDESLGEDA